jgi:hypothetical protein
MALDHACLFALGTYDGENVSIVAASGSELMVEIDSAVVV